MSAGERGQRAPLLIALPGGLAANGVAIWAWRLSNALAARGRPVGLILHAPAPDHRPLAVELHPGVSVMDLTGLPRLEAGTELSPFIAAYRAAVRKLGALAPGKPVVLSPNLLGDCYGIAAALCVADAEPLRVLGVVHNDIEYDLRVQQHYEPMIARFVPVSEHLGASLRARLPARAGDMQAIAHGVAIPEAIPARPALAGRPLRLIYTGRLDDGQKRVRAMVTLSDALLARGIAHELAIVGDGPAAPEVAEAARTRPSLVLKGVQPPGVVTRLLDDSDCFVLASRHEGFSVALLEAAARGCVPIITRTESGSAQLVDDGVSGRLVDVAPDASDDDVGRALAGAVIEAVPQLALLAAASWRRTRARYSLDAHTDAMERVIDGAAAERARAWPASRPCAFAGVGGGSGSVPADGPARLRDLLTKLAGRRIILHGCGRHTIELADVLAQFPALIVAISDDDPARHGKSLWGWPIIPPAQAGRTGATDVVISSWMHQGAIWDRREVYLRQGLAVHRIYQ